MTEPGAARNIVLYPWVNLTQNLIFWQATWFLYFQNQLSASEAILLYAVYEITTTAMEVPSGYMSDRLGRRVTMILSALCLIAGAACLALGSGFLVFALGQMLIGGSTAFSSGTSNSLLFESLCAEDRAQEVEKQELRAWRFSFTGLAVSAALGGLAARWEPTAPFYAGIVSAGLMLGLTLMLREPPAEARSETTAAAQFRHLRAAFAKPVLLWLFALSTLMYMYSHVAYVFGQPFILEALERHGYAAEAPLISGLVSSAMMLVSVLVSLFAFGLRERIGLPAILLLAFGMQIGLSAVLAISNSLIAIAFLFLRMVPDSLSKPFVIARIQPELSSDMRATYLSVQSFVGRIMLSASLFLAAGGATGAGEMPYAEIRIVLLGYIAFGLAAFAALVLALPRCDVARRHAES